MRRTRSRRIRRAGVCLLLAGALTTASCTASSSSDSTHKSDEQPSNSALLDDIQHEMDILTKTGSFPGIVTVVGDKHGSTTLVSGIARRKPREVLSARHRFAIASLTKSMVAAVVMQLVDEHKLALDDTVEELAPGLLEQGDRITVEQLLSHRSGLLEVDDDAGWAKLVAAHPDWPRSRLGARAAVAYVSHRPLDFRPGSSTSYRNTGYLVLGQLIEQVTHHSLADNLRTSIFEPLGMRTASLRRGLLPGAPMAHGYSVDKDVTSQEIFGASGGAVMTAPDVSRFFQGLLAGRVVSASSLKAMTAQHSEQVLAWNGYGYGVARQSMDCGTAFGHSGRLDGYVAESWTVPSSHRSVVVLANRDDNGDGGGVLAHLVSAALCE